MATPHLDICKSMAEKVQMEFNIKLSESHILYQTLSITAQ